MKPLFRSAVFALLMLLAGSALHAQQTATQPLTLNVTGTPVTITNTTLRNGVATVAYVNETAQATGGFGPYTFSVSTGVLPAGLTLNGTTGVISGTPTTAGSTTFTLRATDSQSPGVSGTKQFTIIVYSKLVFTTSTLPNATLGQPYSASIAFTGGLAPYTCSVGSGTLPTGLAITTAASACTLSGTPTQSGSFTFSAQVVDSSAVN